MIFCKTFNCDRRHGNFCCRTCYKKKECKNACQNDPMRCGLARQKPDESTAIRMRCGPDAERTKRCGKSSRF